MDFVYSCLLKWGGRGGGRGRKEREYGNSDSPGQLLSFAPIAMVPFVLPKVSLSSLKKPTFVVGVFKTQKGERKVPSSVKHYRSFKFAIQTLEDVTVTYRVMYLLDLFTLSISFAGSPALNLSENEDSARM